MRRCHLSTLELACLRALEEDRWVTPVEVAERLTGIHSQVIRSTLRQLASRRLVHRGSFATRHCGEFRITATALRELRQRETRGQMQLVDALEQR